MTARLPVIGSTAASTAFIFAELAGSDGRKLYFDGNGKITAGNGTLHEPKPNAFSLVEGGDCPYRTPTCEAACYVHGLKSAQPDLHALYQHNSTTIRELLDLGYARSGAWAFKVAEWITEHAPGGFRWHVSGDIFSMEYAEWIAKVVRRSPTVRHWIYTRSFPYLEALVDVATEHGGNLAINLSCDRDNLWLARRAQETHGVGRLCYLATGANDTLPTAVGDAIASLPALSDDSVIFPDYSLRPRQFATLAESPFWQALTPQQRGLVCPVDAHNKAENRRCGPCDRCLK